MELLVTLLVFGVLAIVAPKFGYDSRDKMQSNEEQLACNGYAWGSASPRPIRPPRKRLRRALARALYGIAALLNPDLRRVRA